MLGGLCVCVCIWGTAEEVNVKRCVLSGERVGPLRACGAEGPSELCCSPREEDTTDYK